MLEPSAHEMFISKLPQLLAIVEPKTEPDRLAPAHEFLKAAEYELALGSILCVLLASGVVVLPEERSLIDDIVQLIHLFGTKGVLLESIEIQARKLQQEAQGQ